MPKIWTVRGVPPESSYFFIQVDTDGSHRVLDISFLVAMVAVACADVGLTSDVDFFGIGVGAVWVRRERVELLFTSSLTVDDDDDDEDDDEEEEEEEVLTFFFLTGSSSLSSS